ncbi:MAG: ATP cone domain-containing protein [Candidatus Paceibacterota bacterium]|jgi:hypothetical protein
MSPKFWVIKANGEREIFDQIKLRDSLRRSGASEEDIGTVVTRILSEMRDGMSTEKIYRHAFALLKRQHKGVAAQYSLRRAIREMGPSGFPFEQYVGEIFRSKGYEVRVGLIIQGWCVEHEVDVSAKKDGTHVLIECKFHNEEGFKTDLKVALYVRERFQDIQKKHESMKDTAERFHEAWLVTNTKLTSKAIEYSLCAGLNVIGWNYPRHGNLQDLVNETRLYPITVLTSLSSADKRRLMDNDIVLFRDLFSQRKMLHGIGLDEAKIERVLAEATALNKMTLT